ncbi:hypothetical protein [Polaromonas sp. DSR2-3-2]|uniref:hypothetical protein n=1 Tax=unclassified Polaromonas TaxID=2638319 RepID=UPI003CEB6548
MALQMQGLLQSKPDRTPHFRRTEEPVLPGRPVGTAWLITRLRLPFNASDGCVFQQLLHPSDKFHIIFRNKNYL